jgi:hypothetical protein
MDFPRFFLLVKQPGAWIALFTLWLIVTDDYLEICHCRFSFLLNSPRDRLSSGSLADRFADDAGLSEKGVGDAFQPCHNSNPKAPAPFNEIRLAFHCLTDLTICTAEPAQPKSNHSANPRGGNWSVAMQIGNCTNGLTTEVSLFVSSRMARTV